MLRHNFALPSNNAVGGTCLPNEQADSPSTYLCGNSLGLLPKRAAELVNEELSVWGSLAVQGHFSHPHGREWMNIADRVHPYLARLVGARESEVACMGTLTANLHLMMNLFYMPTSTRYKILCEARAFPSDQYAFASQVALHGLNPKDAILEVSPREGEFTLREDDILKVIREQGETIALVLFSGIQYYTGQWFPMKSIAQAAKEQGCMCGFDLAHAIGNVPLSLHDWRVDFAVWCSYKYLNSGPGGIAGLYMHDSWEGKVLPKLAGWWGHDPATRFQMPPRFSPIRGAQGLQQSNPSVLATVSLLGSLGVFEEAGMMESIRPRSITLTSLLERKLLESKWFVPVGEVAEKYLRGDNRPTEDSEKGRPGFTIITPSDPESRGAQLSLLFLPIGVGIMQKVFDGLLRHGVVGDERKPDVIRLAPAPLYNTAEDCERAAAVMETVLDSVKA
ncbi:kynureninase [Neolentinus lepideus HHB14362 ss-1]|uniref:Kynureninase n=1 Tax=Neolentinus lepideus HHB14362 ss-1 TaxID=1314782 RepID=A0A165T870_9AGAM|nr:kynureninase [Neolentinus lepideus HHB14362 ss-1]